MKRRFLELMCLTAGLKNVSVSTYRTCGCGGQFAIAVGYKIIATDDDGVSIVNVETPEGFNDAVNEVMQQIYATKGIEFSYINTNTFKI